MKNDHDLLSLDATNPHGTAHLRPEIASRVMAGGAYIMKNESQRDTEKGCRCSISALEFDTEDGEELIILSISYGDQTVLAKPSYLGFGENEKN